MMTWGHMMRFVMCYPIDTSTAVRLPWQAVGLRALGGLLRQVLVPNVSYCMSPSALNVNSCSLKPPALGITVLRACA